MTGCCATGFRSKARLQQLMGSYELVLKVRSPSCFSFRRSLKWRNVRWKIIRVVERCLHNDCYRFIISCNLSSPSSPLSSLFLLLFFLPLTFDSSLDSNMSLTQLCLPISYSDSLSLHVSFFTLSTYCFVLPLLFKSLSPSVPLSHSYSSLSRVLWKLFIRIAWGQQVTTKRMELLPKERIVSYNGL